jgi:drug/metabolite transporter (DMT)-like permease
MFFFWSIVSVIAYSLQGTLLVHYARNLDPLSVSMYRTLSFVITLSPLLFFASPTEIRGIVDFWPQIIGASVCGALAAWTYFEALRFLPAGIQTAFTTGIRTLFIILAGIIFFQEYLSVWEYFFIVVVLFGGIFLGTRKTTFPHLNPQVSKGLALCIFSGFTGMGMALFLTDVARNLNPFVAGYFWEIFIGIASFGIATLRWSFTGKRVQKISWHTFGRIALISWPTILGTGGFTLAVTMGEIGIASAIGASGILMVTILAHFLYREKMTQIQWGALLVVILGIVGLKLVG